MAGHSPSDDDPLRLSAEREVDAVCDSFEGEWQAGCRPAIEDHLGRVAGPVRPRLLRELLRVELEYRRETGERPTEEEYRARFPAHGEVVSSLFPPHASPAGGRTMPSGDRPKGPGAGERAETGPGVVTLTVTAGPHLGQAFTFPGHDRFLVGRSARAHFRLRPGRGKDLYVSRLHFLVEVNPPLCRLHDLGSRNGTYVNGARVSRCDLHDGDEVRAGHTTLRVALAEEPQTLPDAAPGGEVPPIHRANSGAASAPASPPGPPGASCVACRGAPARGASPLCPACQRQADGQPQPLPGYLLLRELGRGAMGVVRLALRRADQALLAVKTIIPAGAPRRGAVERFLREAEILSELDHPHVVRFREMGAAVGQLFFAMDYVRGTDAARLLKRERRLDVRRAVRLVSQLLLALEYAHARGFVHRDIKPANLLLEDRPGNRKRVKVADFGLARVYQASQLSGLTLDNEMGGTLGYMPPEQILNYRDVRPPADQYSAAATLYHLLSGSYVYDFPASTSERLDMILKRSPVPILRRRPELPSRLAAVIHRALARDPEDRYPDVGAFRRALGPFAR